jgi:Protein of unknown function (DUF1488)
LDLQFQPERLVYDPEQGLMWFFATKGTVSVECGISLAALTALAHLSLQWPNAMMSTFQQHQELIQRIADTNTGHTSLTAAARLSLILRI